MGTSGIPPMPNSLHPDQVLHFVGPDLGLNCLHLGYQQTTLGG